MKKTFFVFCCLFIITSVCLAEPPQWLEKTLKKDPYQSYLLQLPAGYNGNTKYPLFIAIHWYTGTAGQQAEEWKFYANKEKYILLCPQFNDGYQQFGGDEDEKLIEIIEEAEKEFSVDKTRIFIVGFSGGAQFVHRFAFKHPDYVRAACVLASGEYNSPSLSSDAKRVRYFIGVGEKDERFLNSKRFYQQLRNLSYNAVFKSYPGVGHMLHSSIKRDVMDFLKGQ